MANGWTPERRKRQSELIHRWRPWERSTGPRTPEGKARMALNPYQGGTALLLRELARALRRHRDCLKSSRPLRPLPFR